ncbi:MAG: class I SAM-dependent methyltransferase [Rudaea sp.]|uniref:SAM-dependent methyltransferase n=1 Tax=unclassified Rudaea TaxID=2627037 RepID=UPI0010F4777A|nr:MULTISPECIES: cyclopropane-fatty-acyl-phospholipid synthase family protein [unclassified Rudaea]MBN8888178.1 class I SAM-dependent methyltransferase [Rudaea sp.]MBR0345233.1 class I SAM-dependent methyltransferase [Rudaea sp.]
MSEISERLATMPKELGPIERMLRKSLLGRLSALRHGRLRVVDAQGTVELGESSLGLADIEIVIVDARFYRALAANGSVGAAEAYYDGWWRCSDLVGLVRLLLRHRDLLDGMERGPARVGGWIMRALDLLRANTRHGARRNIAAHYDLGNELFGLFLSPDLMYSSALFADAKESLEQASLRKLDRICDKLGLGPNDRVLEIGSGWGGFALHAAARYGCHITTTTISREQYDLTRERIVAAGLEDRITVLLDDYRDLRGRYDKIVSIEMVEAIGARQLDSYFQKIGALLEPDGKALVQSITIEDHRYTQALRSVDFIKRHIFPGSFIPSIAALVAAKARSSDLALAQLEDFGSSYALTLCAWRERFLARLAEVRALGYDERFIRLWEFYLAYCEGGFCERSIGVAQLLLVKPGCRDAEYLPALKCFEA